MDYATLRLLLADSAFKNADTEKVEALDALITSLKSRARTNNHVRRTTDGDIAGTITLQDAVILYTLVSHYSPGVIFEIGTWIGTSASVMADALLQSKNAGHIYSCDIRDLSCIPEKYSATITTLHGYSQDVLDAVPRNTPIDIVFTDGECNFVTLQKLRTRLAPRHLFITHDFTLPAEKGVLNYLRLQLFGFGKYSLVSARKVRQLTASDTTIAILYPKYDGNMHIPIRLFNLVIATVLAGFVVLVKVYRKVTNYYAG